MSCCQACTKSYGFFTKESGCPNCGFSFCTKCLKKEIEVPKCNGMKLKVCPRCFEKLEATQRSEELVPGVQKFTLTALTKASPGSSIFDVEDPTSEELGPVLQPLTPPVPEDDDISKNLDSIISKRLKNLKSDDENNKLPSDSEISARLADLKGLPQKTYNNSDLLVSKDHRTDKEKIDDLLKQFVDETSIDNNGVPATSSNPLDDIEKRLAALRGTDYKPNDNTPSDNENEIDEDEAASRIVNRFLEEVNLPNVPIDENEEELLAGLPKPSEATEELPWCAICNEDAIVRCKGCDGELFCRTCFKEVHDDEEYRNHSTESYTAPPKFKENHF